MMKINSTKNGTNLCIGLEGRLDTVTAPELETFINENIAGTDLVTIDCTALEYVSSAGLRVILSVHKKMKGSMKLTGVSEIVMEVFEMTGFADIFEIE